MVLIAWDKTKAPIKHFLDAGVIERARKAKTRRISKHLELIAFSNITKPRQRYLLVGLLKFQDKHIQLTKKQWTAFLTLL